VRWLITESTQPHFHSKITVRIDELLVVTGVIIGDGTSSLIVILSFSLGITPVCLINVVFLCKAAGEFEYGVPPGCLNIQTYFVLQPDENVCSYVGLVGPEFCS